MWKSARCTHNTLTKQTTQHTPKTYTHTSVGAGVKKMCKRGGTRGKDRKVRNEPLDRVLAIMYFSSSWFAKCWPHVMLWNAIQNASCVSETQPSRYAIAGVGEVGRGAVWSVGPGTSSENYLGMRYNFNTPATITTPLLPCLSPPTFYNRRPFPLGIWSCLASSNTMMEPDMEAFCIWRCFFFIFHFQTFLRLLKTNSKKKKKMNAVFLRNSDCVRLVAWRHKFKGRTLFIICSLAGEEGGGCETRF